MAVLDPVLLRQTTVFSSCTEEQCARLAEAGEITRHTVGEVLAEEGSIGHRFRLFLEGEAEVERGGRHVGTVRRGEFMGEIGLLGGGPATATVRCSKPATCLTIWREPFWELLEAEPAIALRILEVVCRRLEQQLARAESPMANLPP